MKKKPRPEDDFIDDEPLTDYDSEMDDFIDDGEEEQANYSKHIRSIFGYDKRKWGSFVTYTTVVCSRYNDDVKQFDVACINILVKYM